jgi:hypothetical protein
MMLDHGDFGLIQSKITVINFNNLTWDASGKRYPSSDQAPQKYSLEHAFLIPLKAS